MSSENDLFIHNNLFCLLPSRSSRKKKNKKKKDKKMEILNFKMIYVTHIAQKGQDKERVY